ncbi:hypothetical protein G9A89_013357 [Geosiphon pyriformis]|nr:hypothetical protein G9A89_013357 [Geosiphon pyriformis]
MTTKSLFITLPLEIRKEIFENLDHGSLFKCLSIDRQRCREIIPLLWSSPFRGHYSPNNPMATLLGCFSTLEWQYLQTNRIAKPPTTLVPSFNYPSFLQELNMKTFTFEVKVFLFPESRYLSLRWDQEQKVEILMQAIIRLFARKGANLKTIWITCHPKSTFWSGLKSPACNQLLKSVDLIRFSNTDPRNFFYLSAKCRNVKHLFYEMETDTTMRMKYSEIRTKGISTSINHFTSLTLIKLPRYSWLLKMLLSNTLQSLRIYQYDFEIFTQEIYDKCTLFVNLKCLDLRFNYRKDMVSPINLSTTQAFFKNMECLSLFCDTPTKISRELVNQTFTRIIETAGRNLKYLRLETTPNGQSSSAIWASLINRTASNLICLEIEDPLSKEVACELLKYFSNLERFSFRLDLSSNAVTAFTEIAEILPYSMRALRIKSSMLYIADGVVITNIYLNLGFLEEGFSHPNNKLKLLDLPFYMKFTVQQELFLQQHNISRKYVDFAGILGKYFPL